MTRIFSSILLFFLLGAFFASATAADAIKLWGSGVGSNEEAEFIDAAGFERGADVETLVGTIINAFLGLLGVIFILLIIYGGFIWMNAQGNEEDVKKAKSIITQATMGLVVVLGAYAISRFVISALTKKTLKSAADALLPFLV